jgi:hypothetical protein
MAIGIYLAFNPAAPDLQRHSDGKLLGSQALRLAGTSGFEEEQLALFAHRCGTW